MIYPSVIMFVAVGIVTLTNDGSCTTVSNYFRTDASVWAPLPGPTQIVINISELFFYSSNSCFWEVWLELLAV